MTPADRRLLARTRGFASEDATEPCEPRCRTRRQRKAERARLVRAWLFGTVRKYRVNERAARERASFTRRGSLRESATRAARYYRAAWITYRRLLRVAP